MIRFYGFVFFLSMLFMLHSCAEAPVSEKERIIPVATANVEMRDLSTRREVTAPVVAYKRVYITALTSGQVVEVNYEEGEKVMQGDVMARLDTRRQAARLRQAEAGLNEIRHQYERALQLFEKAVIPRAEFEIAERQLEEAEAGVLFWQTETDMGIIRAPINAVVSAKLVETGTTVSENQRLFTIEDHNLLVARPGLSEMDVAGLSKGQQVGLTFDIFPGQEFQGSIRRIFPAADPITRLFTVEVEIDQRHHAKLIRPGYLARVHFVTDNREETVVIPPEALPDSEDGPIVYVIENNIAYRREIKTGIRRDGWIEITEGLTPGEMVAAGNLEALQNESKVEITGRFRRYGFR